MRWTDFYFYFNFKHGISISLFLSSSYLSGYWVSHIFFHCWFFSLIHSPHSLFFSTYRVPRIRESDKISFLPWGRNYILIRRELNSFCLRDSSPFFVVVAAAASFIMICTESFRSFSPISCSSHVYLIPSSRWLQRNAPLNVLSLLQCTCRLLI